MINWLAITFLISLIIATYYADGQRKLKEHYKTRLEDSINSLPEQLKNAREDALKRSRSVLKGQISEHLAPFIPEFKHQPSDARFLGSPIDYIIFDGMSEDAEHLKVYIVDIKTGNSRLTKRQRKIKEAVEKGRVFFETVRIK